MHTGNQPDARALERVFTVQTVAVKTLTVGAVLHAATPEQV